MKKHFANQKNNLTSNEVKAKMKEYGIELKGKGVDILMENLAKRQVYGVNKLMANITLPRMREKEEPEPNLMPEEPSETESDPEVKPISSNKPLRPEIRLPIPRYLPTDPPKNPLIKQVQRPKTTVTFGTDTPGGGKEVGIQHDSPFDCQGEHCPECHDRIALIDARTYNIEGDVINIKKDTTEILGKLGKLDKDVKKNGDKLDKVDSKIDDLGNKIDKFGKGNGNNGGGGSGGGMNDALMASMLNGSGSGLSSAQLAAEIDDIFTGLIETEFERDSGLLAKVGSFIGGGAVAGFIAFQAGAAALLIGGVAIGAGLLFFGAAYYLLEKAEDERESSFKREAINKSIEIIRERHGNSDEVNNAINSFLGQTSDHIEKITPISTTKSRSEEAKINIAQDKTNHNLRTLSKIQKTQENEISSESSKEKLRKTINLSVLTKDSKNINTNT